MLHHSWCSAQGTGFTGLVLMELVVGRGCTVASPHRTTSLRHALPPIQFHAIPTMLSPIPPGPLQPQGEGTEHAVHLSATGKERV